MTIVLSIIVLVAIVSLYDYFSSRSWQQTTSPVRNNTVFENRNQDYGAYTIRRDYDKTLTVIIVSFVFGLTGVYATYAAFKTDFSPIPPTTYSSTDVIVPIEIPVKEILEEKIKAAEVEKPKSAEKMKEFLEPEVSDKEIKEKLALQDELDKSKAGPIDLEKKGDGTTTTIVKVVVPEVVIPPAGPTDVVEVEAQFPGGVLEMMKFIQKNLVYPNSAIMSGAQGKCYLRFVVDSAGEISSVKVVYGIEGCPECDKEAIRVLKSMPNWKPGKISGKDVSSYFSLPIFFQLE